MNPLPVGHSFSSFDTIDSTNIYAMQQIRAGLAVHGQVFSAREQTEGRGQRGRRWWSPPGENLQLTVVLQPLQLAASQPFRLSAAMALAVHDLLCAVSDDAWRIKWPNDLYRDDRKAGGILIENVIQSGKWVWAVVGIGLNVNSTRFDPALPNPISLALATGQSWDADGLARQLCTCIERRWQQLLAGGWPALLADYNAVLYKAGSLQRLRRNNITTAMRIQRVNEQGMLLTGENGEYAFAHGEVEWVL
ncbi:MAG: biotin--[acetyl-CoA-carboxylase] ligase [Chitinophagaceae bacterium]|nr:biotin--[acetyl-CoA-carboxylase] ligase [Chitinophagaceae bacterium]